MRRLIYTWLAINSRYLRPLIIGFIVYLYCSLSLIFLSCVSRHYRDF